MIGLVQIGSQQMADRYMYFPAIGLYAAVAWLFPAAWATRPIPKWLAAAAATGLVAIYAGLASLQVGYWRDSVTLFRHALPSPTTTHCPAWHSGMRSWSAVHCDEAIVQLKRAAELDPATPRSISCSAADFSKRTARARRSPNIAGRSALDERNGAAHNNLGLILFRQHRHAEARTEFLRAVELDATDERALVNLALLTNELHEYENSVAYCRRALALDPSLDICRRLIAAAGGVPGRLAEASKNVRIPLMSTQLLHAPTDDERKWPRVSGMSRR